jgi:hypothetical protein
MMDFRLGAFPSSSVLYVYSLRDAIWRDPPYQRMSDVWPPEKRKLLIDSIINGYDIPKLYFHEFFPLKDVKGKKYKYAIIDGKQRLQSIFEFIEGKFTLSPDIEYINDPNVRLEGLTYKELARNYPDLKSKLDGYVLPIVTIQTADIELIEDMFSRLNEAVPLNASEKRNAFGGPLPPIIREQVTLPFFRKRLPFSNTRYRHFDLFVKFLYIEHKGELVDTKKVYLDEFVRDFRDRNLEKEARTLSRKTKAVLEEMANVFEDADQLLRSVGMVTLYYQLFREAIKEGWLSKISHSDLEAFEVKRTSNRAIAEENVADAEYRLLEFDRLAQSPNDGVALKYRYAVLRQYVGPKKGRPKIPGES